MKDDADNQTIDFIKNDKDEMELRLRLEQEQFLTHVLWSIQDAELSKTDIKIFWYILVDVQRKRAGELQDSEPMKPYLDFEIDINAVAELANIAVPNIHRTLRKLEKSFLTKEKNTYSLKFKSR